MAYYIIKFIKSKMANFRNYELRIKEEVICYLSVFTWVESHSYVQRYSSLKKLCHNALQAHNALIHKLHNKHKALTQFPLHRLKRNKTFMKLSMRKPVLKNWWNFHIMHSYSIMHTWIATKKQYRSSLILGLYSD